MNATDRWLTGEANRRRIAARVADFLEYLLMLVVLLECNSMYCFARETVSRVDMNPLLVRAGILLAAAALALRLWLNPRKLREALPNGAALAALVACCALFFFLNVRGQGDWQRKTYILNFVLFMPLAAALFKVKQREGKGLDLLFKYSDIVCAVAGLSLAVYLASVLRPDSVPGDEIYSLWYDTYVPMSQLDLLDVCQSAIGIRWQMFGIVLLRNCGFFTEPLMFALPLLIALFTELFLRDRRSRLRVLRWVLLSATLITVNSTIGVMLTAAAWGLKIISALLERGKRWLVIPIVVLAIAAVGVLFLEKGKTTFQSTGEVGNSLGDHIDDYSASLQAFATSPILGVGYQNEQSIYPFMQPYRLVNPGLSNTLGVVLAEGGLVFGLLCLAPFLIWLMYLFRRRDWRVACWGLGALGVAAGIIFKYHLILLVMIAFGYSLLDFQTDEGRLRLSLADTAGQRRDAAYDDEGRKGLPVWLGDLLAAAVFFALVLFGAPLWNALHTLLRSHQFSVAQSPLRAFCFAVALLLNGVALRGALRREVPLSRCAALAVWDAIYLLIYPALFSRINTLLTLAGLWGELRECALLLIVWLVPAALMLLIQPRAWLNRRGAIGAGIVAAAIAAAVFGGNLYADRRADASDPLAAELEAIVQAARGPVYANDLPLLYHRQVKGVGLTTTRDSGFELKENASIVFEAGNERRELLEKGFQAAALSDGHLLYTNDAAVIDALSGEGARFYRYYAFGHAMDMEWLAELNGLTLTEGGAAVVEGPVESLTSGPFDTLYAGEYAVAYSLHADPAALAALPADGLVCRASVTRRLGEIPLVDQPVSTEAFDGTGDAVIYVPLYAPETWDSVEYRLLGEADVPVEVRAITLYRTPAYVTVTDYNSHRDPIRQAFYTADGAPFYPDGVYAILEQDFNATNQVVAQRYFDADGNPVLVGTGYAEVRYTYNRKGILESQSFYGADGQPILVSGGYAALTYEYDAYGNCTVTRFYGTDGSLAPNWDGYAILRRQFDENRGIILEEHLDAQGNPI